MNLVGGAAMIAHQKIIRDQRASEKPLLLFPDEPKTADIKSAVVRPVSYKTAEKIILEYEWLGCMPAIVKYQFGIFFDGYCGGVVCFGDEYSENLGHWDKYGYTGKMLLLSRGACVHWAHPHSASKLIMGSIKQLPAKYEVVTATVDSLAGEIGTIYQACNFVYVGSMRDSNPNVKSRYKDRDAWLIDGKLHGTRSIRSKIGTQKIDEIRKYYPTAEKVKQVSKSRYFLFRGSKRTRKKHLSAIKHLLKPYPNRSPAQQVLDLNDVVLVR
jgi:hypothetical protein